MKERSCTPYILFVILVMLVAFWIFLKFAEKNLYITPVTINATTTTTTPTTTIPTHTPEIIRSCAADTDCTWLSTNCCPETAGANWDCINRKSNVTCSGFTVICPQVISPKPSLPCKCIEGVCSVA